MDLSSLHGEIDAVERPCGAVGLDQSRDRDGVGPGTPAGTRMAEAAAYMEFLKAELPTLFEKWHTRRDELGFT